MYFAAPSYVGRLVRRSSCRHGLAGRATAPLQRRLPAQPTAAGSGRIQPSATSKTEPVALDVEVAHLSSSAFGSPESAADAAAGGGAARRRGSGSDGGSGGGSSSSSSSSSSRAVVAQVCIVDRGGGLLLNAFCLPELRPGERVSGGIDASRRPDARPLAEVRQAACKLIQGRLVVGHGVFKDLAALGLSVPLQLVYDTVTFAGFQGAGGTARPLRRLARERLGRVIQAPGRPHDALEDARAAMALYVKFVEPRRITQYGDLVDYYTQQLLAEVQARQLRLQGPDEEDDDGNSSQQAAASV